MIVGSGIDLVEIGRIQQSMDRYGKRFLDRVYTAAEQAYCLRKRKSAESFAARFAAKEAGAKALGTGISYGVSWLEIEVVREPSGRPTPAVSRARRRDCGHAGRSQRRAFHHPHRRPCHGQRGARRWALNSLLSAILKASLTGSFQQGECRAKPQRDSVVATESGSFGPGGHGRAGRADFSHVRLDGRAVCAQARAALLL